MPRLNRYDDHLPSFLRREEFPVDRMLLQDRIFIHRSHRNNASYPPWLVTRTDYYAIRFEDPTISTLNMFVDSFFGSSSSYRVISEDIMSYEAFSLWIEARYRERFEWRFLEEYQCVVLLRDWIDDYSEMSDGEVRADYSGGIVVRHVWINSDDDDDQVEWINSDDDDDDDDGVEEDVIPSPSVSHRQGLSEEDLSKRLKTKMVKTCDREEGMICVVCQENLYEKDDLQIKIGVIKCGHEFHELCIREWLKEKNSCPLCKSIAIIL